MDIINPKNIEPESPINILAGLKLWTKNPKLEPNIIKVSKNAKSSLHLHAASTPMNKKNIADIPLASPSNPSIVDMQIYQNLHIYQMHSFLLLINHHI